MRYSLVLIAMYLLVITGCSTSHAVRTSADPDQDQAMLGEIAKLVGPWEMSDEEGKKHLTATFAVTAGGSAVREIMFPGDAHEMTNLYHMDGTSLVLTHYCAAGNQPRMVASSVRETDSGTVFHFDRCDLFDSRSGAKLQPVHIDRSGHVVPYGLIAFRLICEIFEIRGADGVGEHAIDEFVGVGVHDEDAPSSPGGDLFGSGAGWLNGSGFGTSSESSLRRNCARRRRRPRRSCVSTVRSGLPRISPIWRTVRSDPALNRSSSR